MNIFYKIVTLTIPKIQKGITHFTIVKILKKFSQAEINEFEKLLNSPFYNNHSTIVKLFRELRKYYPQFEDKDITKEYLFSIVTGGKKYNDKLFRKYLSRINKLAEEYLNIIQTRLEQNKKDLNIMYQLSKRDLKDTFTKKLKIFEKNFGKDPKIDGDNFFLMHQLSIVKYNHKISENNFKPHEEDFMNSYENVVNYFILDTSSVLNQLESNNYTFKTTGDENPYTLLLNKSRIEEYINAVIKTTSPGNKNRILFLEIMLNDIKMNSSPEGMLSYKNLKKLIYSNSEKLSKRMLFHFLLRMNIFCITENARGKHDLNKEIFENYKMMLENNLFNTEGPKQLTLIHFRQILLAALTVMEYSWAEKFINENLNSIKEEIKMNTLHYGNSILMFYKGNFQDSLNHIAKIRSETVPVTIDIYVLKAKNFYMLGYLDSAYSVSDSFRHFITGNKVIGNNYKASMINFLKYFNKILRLKVKPDKSSLNNLLAELKDSSNVKEKKWMIQTIEQLSEN